MREYTYGIMGSLGGGQGLDDCEMIGSWHVKNLKREDRVVSAVGKR